jgi:YVTN family beta-propeller protein
MRYPLRQKQRAIKLPHIVCSLAAALLVAACGATGLPLARVADIALPGNATRLDYQTLDAGRHLLFIAHLGDSQIVVVDTKTRRVVRTISGISSVHGVLAVPQLDTIYASATGANEVVAMDESSFQTEARIPGGVYPDGMAFDPDNGRLYVSDERGDTETVIDTSSNTRVATINLGGEVGNTQFDPVSHHVFVNVQTSGRLVEIDPRTNRILRRIPLPGCAGNHGLSIDPERRRAFVACEENATFVWLDLRNAKVVKSWSIGNAPDVLALDPVTHRLYAASESGVVSVFSDESSVSRVAQGFLAPGAHTVAVDPLTHLVYFPLERIAGTPVLRILAPMLRQTPP